MLNNNNEKTILNDMKILEYKKCVDATAANQ